MIVDGDLKSWEVYATTGDHGFADPARIVFRCVSDPGQRPRAVQYGGDKSEAEAAVVELSDQDLKRMLDVEAKPIG